MISSSWSPAQTFSVNEGFVPDHHNWWQQRHGPAAQRPMAGFNPKSRSKRCQSTQHPQDLLSSCSQCYHRLDEDTKPEYCNSATSVNPPKSQVPPASQNPNTNSRKQQGSVLGGEGCSSLSTQRQKSAPAHLKLYYREKKKKKEKNSKNTFLLNRFLRARRKASR